MTISDATGGRHQTLWLLAAAVVAVFVSIRCVMAGQMPLLGDEAYYWWAGQNLAWSYSDLPPATAWLTRLGVEVMGQSYLGVRWPFLLLSLSVVPLLRGIAVETGAAISWIQAWVLAGVVPLAHISGSLALPEAPLAAVSLLTVWQCLRSLRTCRLSDWLLLGLICALGWIIHIRFAWVVAGLGCFWLFNDDLRGRLVQARSWRGPWLAGMISLLGLVPMIWFNWANDLTMLKFQLVERHPWSFQPMGLLQPVTQAVLVTPVLYVAIFIAGWRSLDFRGATRSSAIVAAVVIVPWLLIVIFGVFADLDRTTFHWPFSFYLIGLALLDWRNGKLAAWIIAPALVLGAAFVALMAVHAQASHSPHIPRKAVVENVLGWREIGQAVAAIPPNVPVVADNFMTGAQLAFETGREVVGVMDHPLNDFHGRRQQLAIWGLNQGTFELPGSAVLVWEETAIDAADRLTWLEGACRSFGSLLWLGDVSIRSGKKRFVLFEAVGPATQGGGLRRCDLPPLIELVQVELGGDADQLRLSGWAVDADSAVQRVEIRTDEGRLSLATLNFRGRGGTPPFVALQGHQRNYGFVALVGPPPGEWIWARVYTQDGRFRDSRALAVKSLQQRAERASARLTQDQ